MNLDFSDDQKFLQDEAKKFFDKEGGLANARRNGQLIEGDRSFGKKLLS